jgi:hypothetical protein
MAYPKNAYPLLVVCMNVLAPMNKSLKCLDLGYPQYFLHA